MPRTVRDYQFFASKEMLFNSVGAYLASEGYDYVQYHGENLFKKGKGIASGPTFIKLSFGENIVRLEAWLKFAALPGVYAGESGLDGALGFAVKGPLKKRFAWIESMIFQQGGSVLGNPINPTPLPIQTPAPNSMAMQQPVQPIQAPTQPYQQTAAEPSSRRFCANCGTAIEPGMSFCPKCGRAV